MAKHSFVFCTQCKTMFLESELKGKYCPNCNCKFIIQQPEKYVLDPFEPQEWPFKKCVLHKKFHHISTNSSFEFEVKKGEAFKKVFFSFAAICFLVYYFHGVIEKGVTAVLLIVLPLFFIITIVFFEFRRICISIDRKNVYLQNIAFGIFKQERVVPKNNCRIRFTSYLDEKAVIWSVFLYYIVDGVEKKVELECYSDEEKLNDIMRWMSMFLKYAYNEELLPEPETKYGKALPPADEGDHLIVDEGEKLAVQKE